MNTCLPLFRPIGKDIARKNVGDDYIVRGVLMDLTKAFDCIAHDLLIAKLDSYGLKYINSYLDNRKQGVHIDDINSSFNDIISGVPQASVVGPILFNTFLNIFSSFCNIPQFITSLMTTHFQASQKLLLN